MKILGKIAIGIFMLCLPVLLITRSIGYIANNAWLYQYEFDKHNVGDTTGLTESELERVARGLISYFNSGEEYINLTVLKDDKAFVIFNQREVIHLKDAKALIRLNYWVLLGTLVYVLGYGGVCLFRRKGKYWPNLAWGVLGGGVITLIIMLVLWLGTLLNFDRLFLQFHLLSFANDFWQLNPARDYLIMFVPRGFWYDVTLLGALVTGGTALILIVAAEGYLFLNGKSLLFRRLMA